MLTAKTLHDEFDCQSLAYRLYSSLLASGGRLAFTNGSHQINLPSDRDPRDYILFKQGFDLDYFGQHR
jgi:hypothetical protein